MTAATAPYLMRRGPLALVFGSFFVVALPLSACKQLGALYARFTGGRPLHEKGFHPFLKILTAVGLTPQALDLFEFVRRKGGPRG